MFCFHCLHASQVWLACLGIMVCMPRKYGLQVSQVWLAGFTSMASMPRKYGLHASQVWLPCLASMASVPRKYGSLVSHVVHCHISALPTTCQPVEVELVSKSVSVSLTTTICHTTKFQL